MWLFASRGRPQSYQRFIDAWVKTKGSTPVYVRLDECDSTIEEYKKIVPPKEFMIVIGKRARLGAAMTEIYEKYPNESFYGLLADDLIPRTEYWDSKMINAAGSKCFSQANDLTDKPLNCCHPCIGGDLVRAAGFFGFPHATHYYLEVVWKELKKKDGRFLKYLPDVIVENAHYKFNKATFDATYKDAQSVKSTDKKIWVEWKENKFDNFYSELIKKINQDDV
jgi:hypothetical protein